MYIIYFLKKLVHAHCLYHVFKLVIVIIKWVIHAHPYKKSSSFFLHFEIIKGRKLIGYKNARE